MRTCSAPAPELSTTSVSSVPPAVVELRPALFVLDDEPVRFPRLRFAMRPARDIAGAGERVGTGSERFEATLDFEETILTLSLALLLEMEREDEARALFAAAAASAAAEVI